MSDPHPTKLIGTFLEDLVQGNPFVTSLEKLALSENELSQAVTKRSDKRADFVFANPRVKEIALDKGFYICPPNAYELYMQIRTLIIMGYVNRHPASNDYDKYLHLQDLRAIPAPEKIKDPGNSIFIRGRSGEGKTTLINSILRNISVTIEHEPSHLTGGRKIRQVSWVKIDMSKGVSRKGFYLNVIQQIDLALGTSFATRIRRSDVEEERLIYMIKVCRMACLGLLVIDDVQWALSGNAANANGKVTNEFLEQLFNQLGVPLLFIGTPEAEKLKGFAEQTGRRLAHNGMIEIHAEPVESAFWHHLVTEVFTSFFRMPNEAFNPSFYHMVHYYSEGNGSRLKSIVAHLLRKGVSGVVTDKQIYDAYVQEKGAFERIKTPFVQLSENAGKSLNRKSSENKHHPDHSKNIPPDEPSGEEDDDFEDAFIIKGSLHE